MAKTKKKQNKKTQKNKKGMGAGGVVALIIAGILLVGILAGVVYFVHSGRAGAGESAGIFSSNQTTVASETEEVADGDDSTTLKAGSVSADDVAEEAEANANATTTVTGKEGETSGSVVFKSKTTAKQLAKYFDTDIEAFRDLYDGKTVTVTGTLKSKSSKLLYVELKTGTDVPLRVYLSGEDQREQFNNISNGTSVTVKGSIGVVYPTNVDAGGYQEMANGLIAVDSASLVS